MESLKCVFNCSKLESFAISILVFSAAMASNDLVLLCAAKSALAGLLQRFLETDWSNSSETARCRHKVLFIGDRVKQTQHLSTISSICPSDGSKPPWRSSQKPEWPRECGAADVGGLGHDILPSSSAWPESWHCGAMLISTWAVNLRFNFEKDWYKPSKIRRGTSTTSDSEFDWSQVRFRTNRFTSSSLVVSPGRSSIVREIPSVMT